MNTRQWVVIHHLGVFLIHGAEKLTVESACLPCLRLGAVPCECHEGCVCPYPFRLLAQPFRVQLRITAVAIEDPGLTAVTQTEVEDFPQPLFGTRGGHRRHYFHTPGEIAEHPVGRAQVKFALEGLCLASGEMEDPRVFEKASDDGAHTNAFAATGDARPEAAEALDDQVDRYTCTGCFTQRFNDLGVSS